MPDQDEASEESTMCSSSSSWTRSNTNYSAVKVSRNQGQGGGGPMNVLIKPKERLGQSMQAKTITNKNSLMEIGSYPNTGQCTSVHEFEQIFPILHILIVHCTFKA